MRTVAAIHRFFAWLFAVGGLNFLLFPNLTVRSVNAVGSLFRVFPPAPESDLKIWLGLAVAYMAMVSALAWRIADDPVKNRPLMFFLGLGKFMSSFLSLVFFITSAPTFLYLLNFLVDGSIVLVVAGCYLWLGTSDPGGRQGEPVGRTGELLSTVTHAMVGSDRRDVTGNSALTRDVWHYFDGLHPLGTTALTVILSVIDWAPYLFGPRHTRFSRLTPTERSTALEGWESSRLAPRRQLIHALKLVVMLHHYETAEASASIGYDGSYLRDKLLAGPNAAFHRARLGLAP